MIDLTAIDDSIGYMTEMRSICSVPDGNVAKAYDTALACLRECAERRERAADVAPVVHGEWESGCSNGMGTEYCYCSKCSEDALKDKSGYTELSTFCPSCGAKMDGGDT